MKKLFLVMMAAVMLLTLTACQPSNLGAVSTNPNESVPQTGKDHTDLEGGVEVQVANATWGENGMTLNVKWINATSHEVIYGASYRIERKEGDGWVSCATAGDLVFDEVAYILPAGQTIEEAYAVSGMFDVSKAGTYRFQSDCYVADESGSTDRMELWAEFTVSEDLDESEIAAPVEYGVQYIRTDGYRDGAKFPRVEIIRSAEELSRYYEANKGTFNLERRANSGADDTKGFLDACDKYDDAYFEKGYLVFVLLEVGSGSTRFEVEETAVSSDGELDVYIKTISPEIGTCDMAEWHIILEMSNAVKVKDAAGVQVYLNGSPAHEKGTVVSKTIGTQTPVIFKDPPAAKLLYENGSTPLLTAGYSWTYPNGDDTMAAVIVDHAHPLFCQKILDPIYVTGGYGKLAFEDDPDSIEIQCWPDSAWNSSTAVSETVACYDTAFDLKQGGYIYEITAQWNEDETEHYGTVSYFAYIVSGGEHTHKTALEPQTVDDPVSGYCGNTQTTLYIDGEAYTFMYDESVTLTDILVNLDYDPDKECNCLPEYTVDTEFGKGYGINLTDGYARCGKGQAELTAGQVDQIRAIIEWAGKAE